MKFILFVEGYTEQKAVPRFLKRWLDDKLQRPVGVQAVRFEGWSELVDDAPVKAAMYRNSPKQKQDIIAVIALIDLYGPTFYPSHLRDASDRFNWAKQHLEAMVNQERFRQFFAVHEAEAWLLRDPAIFPRDVANSLPGKIQHPETINFDLPPAKLLDRLYESKTKSGYKKVVFGQELFSKLNPADAYEKCPYLRMMLDEMLLLAQQAGL